MKPSINWNEVGGMPDYLLKSLVARKLQERRDIAERGTDTEQEQVDSEAFSLLLVVWQRWKKTITTEEVQPNNAA